MSSIGTQNRITNIGQLAEGLKVVLSIEGRDILDARVRLGTGTSGKPRVWFCQNTVSGANNNNDYGYDYAFSVGVKADGSLKLSENDVQGLRAYDEYRAAIDEAARRTELRLRREELAAEAARRRAALRVGSPTLTLADGRDVSAYDYAEDGLTTRVVGVSFNGVKYADGTASAGMEFKTVARFAGAIADRERAIAKYRACKEQYDAFAYLYGWSRV